MPAVRRPRSSTYGPTVRGVSRPRKTHVTAYDSHYEAPKPTSTIRVKFFGRRAVVEGLITRLYRIEDIAQLWPSVTDSQVRNWYNRGVLPTPYMTRPGRTFAQPFWLMQQATVIHQVINAHWLAGFVSLSPRHVRTVDLLWAKSAMACNNYVKRAERVRRGVYRKGVEWIDRPDIRPDRIDRKNTKVTLWETQVDFMTE